MSTLSSFRFSTAALSSDLPAGRVGAVWEKSTIGRTGEPQIIHIKERLVSRTHVVTPQSTGSATTSGGSPLSSDLAPDHLTFAQHAKGTSVSLCFSDGCTATVDLATLGINTSRWKLKTARASSDGDAVEVKDNRGKTVHIDSAVLRSHCDPKYAAELRKAIADLIAR
jgi:hypothetical protein